MNEGSNQHDIREIVVFDFDGTITTKDTFALFLRYYAGAFVWFVKIFDSNPNSSKSERDAHGQACGGKKRG